MKRLIGLAGVLAFVLAGTGCASYSSYENYVVPENRAVYDTAGEPKALGLKAKVAYPAGWESRPDEKRPSMLRSFTRVTAPNVEYLFIQVIDIDPAEAALLFGGAADFESSRRKERWIERLSGKPKDTEILDIAPARHDGMDVVVADMVVLRGDPGDIVYLHMKMYMLYHESRMVFLTCGVGGPEEEKVNLEAIFEQDTRSVCKDYFSSLKLEKNAG